MKVEVAKNEATYLSRHTLLLTDCATQFLNIVLHTCLSQAHLVDVVVVVVVYPTPSEGWGHGGRPWSPRSRATPQGLDQRS